MRQFFVKKAGGIHKVDFNEGFGANERSELLFFEGTEDKGPWYFDNVLTEERMEKAVKNDWIVFMKRPII